MKKLVSKKLFSILVVALFMICFAGVAVAEETVKTEEIKGVISYINLDTGQVTVLEESGEMVTVTASSDIDLKAFTAGDKVVIECNDNIIKSITRQH